MSAWPPSSVLPRDNCRDKTVMLYCFCEDVYVDEYGNIDRALPESETSETCDGSEICVTPEYSPAYKPNLMENMKVTTGFIIHDDNRISLIATSRSAFNNNEIKDVVINTFYGHAKLASRNIFFADDNLNFAIVCCTPGLGLGHLNVSLAEEPIRQTDQIRCIHHSSLNFPFSVVRGSITHYPRDMVNLFNYIENMGLSLVPYDRCNNNGSYCELDIGGSSSSTGAPIIDDEDYVVAMLVYSYNAGGVGYTFALTNLVYALNRVVISNCGREREIGSIRSWSTLIRYIMRHALRICQN